MNWAAGLYAAAIWTLAATVWVTIRAEASTPTASNAALVNRVARDLIPGVLIGLLIARLV